jgi:hypothetical protein
MLRVTKRGVVGDVTTLSSQEDGALRRAFGRIHEPEARQGGAAVVQRYQRFGAGCWFLCVRRFGADVEYKIVCASKPEDYSMPTQLTSTSNGCDRETGEGQKHVGSKTSRGRSRCRPARRQGKTYTVNAILRESQAGDLNQVMAQQRLTRQRREGDRCRLSPIPNGDARSHIGQLDPVTRTTSHREANSRTGHLPMSHLNNCANAGSPGRMPLRCSVWRRSCHSSQMPGVMPRTAITVDGHE